MQRHDLQIPESWKELAAVPMRGLLMIVGASDTGKSTLARLLVDRLNGKVAHLDGDPGQSNLGPPTTLTLELRSPEQAPQRWRTFVGAISPTGHMLPLVSAAVRLVRKARDSGAETIVYDTTGLVDPNRGGFYLKLAKIDLLEPDVLIALQRGAELEPLLRPLRKSARVQLVELPVSPHVRIRERLERRRHRAQSFARYFADAKPIPLRWSQYAVFPAPDFHLHQLLALENQAGFLEGLAIILEIDRVHRELLLLTPLDTFRNVDALRLAYLQILPDTFEDRTLSLHPWR